MPRPPTAALLTLMTFGILTSNPASGAPAAPAPGGASTSTPLEDRTHIQLPPRLPGEQQAIRGRQELAAFGIELPRGWRKVGYRPAAGDVGESVRFEGPGGLYFSVEVNPAGQGVSADTQWRCAIVDGRVRVHEEEPFCVVPPGVEVEEEGCAAGDGRLDVFAPCDPLVFYFGNTRKERGVDLEVFREILRSVRTR